MIIKVVVLGVAALFLSLTLKKLNVQAALVLLIATGVVILLLMHNEIFEIVTALKRLASRSNIPDNYIKLIINTVFSLE